MRRRPSPLIVVGQYVVSRRRRWQFEGTGPIKNRQNRHRCRAEGRCGLFGFRQFLHIMIYTGGKSKAEVEDECDHIPDGGSSFGNPLIGCRPILYNITFLLGDPYIYIYTCVCLLVYRRFGCVVKMSPERAGKILIPKRYYVTCIILGTVLYTIIIYYCSLIIVVVIFNTNCGRF